MNGDDFWRELMEEIPGGSNHGRKRSPHGEWEELGTEHHKAHEEELFVDYGDYVVPLKRIKHGSLSAYTTDKCRCEVCRAVWRVYHAERRKRSS